MGCFWKFFVNPITPWGSYIFILDWQNKVSISVLWFYKGITLLNLPLGTHLSFYIYRYHRSDIEEKRYIPKYQSNQFWIHFGRLSRLLTTSPTLLRARASKKAYFWLCLILNNVQIARASKKVYFWLIFVPCSTFHAYKRCKFLIFLYKNVSN